MHIIDSKLKGFADFVQALGQAFLDQSNEVVNIEELRICTPVELEVQAGADQTLTITASPPTQQFATSFMPVFHHMTIRLVVNNG